MKVEERKIELVYPYDNNPRKNQDAVAAVAASIKEFGWQQPIVIDTAGVIICGHTRFAAAKSLGLASVPVVVAANLSPEQIRAYRIADNKTGEIAGWDNKLLSAELESLLESGFDLDVLAFSPDELQRLIAAPAGGGVTDPDAVPLPPDEPRTKSGDLWVLGSHRLLCGNSASESDLDRLLDGAVIHLVNTDPPYNVKVEPRSNNAIAAGLSSFPGASFHHQSLDPEKAKATHKKMRAKDRPLANDFITDAAFDKMLDGWFGNIARVLAPGGSFYIWGGRANCVNYPPFLVKHDLYFSQAIIWVKEHPVMTRKDFMGNHEWCFYGWKEGAAHRWLGPRNIQDVWQISRGGGMGAQGCKVYPLGDGLSVNSVAGVGFDVVPADPGVSRRSLSLEEGATLQFVPGVGDVWFVKKMHSSKTVHLTEKPVELAARAIRYSSRPGENVLDLFGGSGSTLIACEQLGRRGFLMELDTQYCDVIVRRWEEFSGLTAELVRD